MTTEDNLSLVLHGANDLRLEQTPLPPPPNHNEVQLATHTGMSLVIRDRLLIKLRFSVGICGSDVHFYAHGRLDAWVVEKPMIMGHESSATVVAVGVDVIHLNVGDRVAVEPGLTCRRCQFCTSGRYNLCREVIFQSVPPNAGSLRRVYNHRADLCHKLSDAVDFAEGAIIEPLAVAVHACKKLRIDRDNNRRLLVTGAGSIGLLCALTARAYGVRDICIIGEYLDNWNEIEEHFADINESRLKMANDVGITMSLLINKEDDTKTVVERVVQLLGDSPDVSLDCTGVESCLDIAISGTKEGGRVGLIGLNHCKVSVSLSNAGFNELELIGVRRYMADSYIEAIRLVAEKKINVKPLISHVFKLEEAIEAFDTARKCPDGVIKVQIVCQ